MVMENNYKYYYKKKAKDENFNGGSKSRSQNNNNKSNYGNGRRQPSMLALENEFCLAVGGVTWNKVLEAQKYIYQDEKVLHWEDSAAQEAFWNAKKRFLAMRLGEPCNVELPDPDIFIDEINWDSDVDHKLMLELDDRNLGVSCENDRKDRGVVIGIPVVPEQYAFTPMGWGDAEEGGQQMENPERQDGGYDYWVDEGVNNAKKDYSNSWEDGCAYNVPHDKFKHEENRYNNSNSNGGATWNSYRNKHLDHRYNKKSKYGGRNTSRHKISPYDHNDQFFTDDHGGRKRGERRPLSQWRPVVRPR